MGKIEALGFRTGTWSGWYGYSTGQRGATSMEVTMLGGEISGQGEDTVGSFEIRGIYNGVSGEFSYNKRYINAHTIVYEGKIDAGALKGRWHSKDDASWGGNFLLELTPVSAE